MSHVNQVKSVAHKGVTLWLLGESFGKPSIEVLRSKAKGITSTAHSTILYSVDSNDYRQATLNDFKEFRVAHSNAYLIAKPTM
jgi:hypothetical protein